MKPKLLRITTVPLSLHKLVKGQPKFMKSQGFDVVLASADGPELKYVKETEKVPHVIIPYTRTISPLKDLWTLFLTVKLILKIKPTIIHTHTPKAGVVGMLAAWLTRVPNRLHTVAGLPLLVETGKKRKLLNWVEKLTYACATKVYPNSKGLFDIIVEEEFCPKEKLKVLANGSSNGIDTNYFSPESIPENETNRLRESLGFKTTDLVFVFVGRVVADKGINELVKAFQKLSNQYDHIKLLIVGPFEKELDPLSEEVERIIASNKSIYSVGYQDDVRPYFLVSNVLSFPSYREGFPNVVMQAGALGLPAIVSDINGCNEIIKEGVNGYIIPVASETALHDAMKRLIENQDELIKMKERARDLIVNRYEQQLVWDLILEEYNTLL